MTDSIRVPLPAGLEEVEPVIIRPIDSQHLLFLIEECLKGVAHEGSFWRLNEAVVVSDAAAEVIVTVSTEPWLIQVATAWRAGHFGRAATTESINRLNTATAQCRWVLADGTVWLSAEIPADPYVSTHFVSVMEAFLMEAHRGLDRLYAVQRFGSGR